MNFDKFLRYTIPGLVALLVFYFLISLTKSVDILNIKGTEISLGYIAGLVFVTGGLGAIFNSIYWAVCHFFYYPLNHTKLIISLKDKLKVTDKEGNLVKDTTKREAWSIFNTYWYSKTNLRTKFEAINPRVDRLSDVTHGLGTTFVGIVSAFTIWIILFLKFESSFILPFAVGLMLIILNFSNYVYSLKMYQTLLNTTFASVLNEDLNQMKKEDSNNNIIEITLIK